MSVFPKKAGKTYSVYATRNGASFEQHGFGGFKARLVCAKLRLNGWTAVHKKEVSE